MCKIVNFNGNLIETVGALKACVETILPVAGKANIDADNYCLCNVDLKLTAEVNGLDYRETTWAESEDTGDVFFTFPPHFEEQHPDDCGCTPFTYCAEHEPPPIEHKVLGVCAGCGEPAHTTVRKLLFCFPCAYDAVN